MNPFYFGTPNRRLFGVQIAARSGGRRGAVRAVLLCPPWGQEYLRAHRSMRRLAELLAAAGCEALRFDYYGTGDSAGDMPDATVPGWELDIEAAIDELKDASGARKVGIVGLRLGGTLAARVAARRARDIAALVLWDPVISGAEYLDELFLSAHSREHAAERPRQRSIEEGGGHELLGFRLPAAFASAIGDLRLAAVVSDLPGQTHCVVSQSSRSADVLRQALAGSTAALRVAEIPGRPPWTEVDQIMSGEVPVQLLHHIVEVLCNGASA